MFSRSKVEEEKKVVKGKHTKLDDDDEEIEEEELTESEENISDGDEEEDEGVEDVLQSGLKKELNKMSFEEVQKLQNKLGLKKFKEALESEKTIKNEKRKSFKRLNKNRPQEVSSKKPATLFRSVFQTQKVERIDPRFSNAFGEYKPEFFSKSYGFINNMRENEVKVLEEQLKQETDSEERTKIKVVLQRLKQQLKSNQENEKKRDLDKKLKETAMKDAKEGKKPHFVNKTERKILELAERYKELKKSGKVDKFLAKKRKKNLGKANKHLIKNNAIE